mmetsp:Transcript_2930/g.4289  ORF Transcript_2930/g.4289 Transcript_2930/m.4289 type:complete len:300 (-) Transcript_2930:164-1063(-)
MSVVEESDDMMYCASCGIGQVDDVKKLKDCSACKLVKYCGVKCQKEHRPQHKRACKQRAAELRDEILFKQPESSHWGDCPICCLPLPLDQRKIAMTGCCSKTICSGCHHTNVGRELEGCLDHKCLFCRQPTPNSDEEFKRNMMKRIEAKDPVSIYQMGFYRNQEGDYDGAIEYFKKAAGLGDLGAHYELTVMYRNRHGVEKDKKKEVYHLEKAAICGVPFARHNLGCIEEESGRPDRATKHFIIAAKLGYDNSMKTVKEGFKGGLVSKEDFAATLRGHQAAVDATKSPQREEAELARKL